MASFCEFLGESLPHSRNRTTINRRNGEPWPCGYRDSHESDTQAGRGPRSTNQRYTASISSPTRSQENCFSTRLRPRSPISRRSATERRIASPSTSASSPSFRSIHHPHLFSDRQLQGAALAV